MQIHNFTMTTRRRNLNNSLFHPQVLYFVYFLRIFIFSTTCLHILNSRRCICNPLTINPRITASRPRNFYEVATAHGIPWHSEQSSNAESRSSNRSRVRTLLHEESNTLLVGQPIIRNAVTGSKLRRRFLCIAEQFLVTVEGPSRGAAPRRACHVSASAAKSWYTCKFRRCMGLRNGTLTAITTSDIEYRNAPPPPSLCRNWLDRLRPRRNSGELYRTCRVLRHPNRYDSRDSGD